MIIEFRDSGLSVNNGQRVVEGGSPVVEAVMQMFEAADYGETEFTLLGFPGGMLADLRRAFAAGDLCCPNPGLQIIEGGNDSLLLIPASPQASPQCFNYHA